MNWNQLTRSQRRDMAGVLWCVFLWWVALAFAGLLGILGILQGDGSDGFVVGLIIQGFVTVILGIVVGICLADFAGDTGDWR